MKKFIILVMLAVVYGCNSPEKKADQQTNPNPAAEGFNEAGSDQRAIAIADSIMVAMGGRKNYDNLRYIAWNFFGARDLVWDKHSNRVRIDVPSKQTTYLVNINTLEGRVFKDTGEITDPDSLRIYLKRAKDIWINDSYWLVMPFKLKDSGVTLKYSREDTTATGIRADVLTLTFENVGSTPENKYEIYVDKADHLVKQWAYFKDAGQEIPSAIWPWDNYSEYDGVMLSSDRSDGKGPHKVSVFRDLPDKVFSSFDKPAL
ncbi:hypothetical protein LVD17_09750 [Fulvivirga ulvae]|uniref:hypothetical protein n=1 Tax=Fulvivirga ulvae TaxID=2904245 RepID=UPI001F3B9F15|nr:hypothetical protein [Fulvivirga ulvae]UII34097.1 hypothetical protein LVD17_09750 [Fulvivirga ulvae]